jgi:hypothetical protein
MDSYEREFGAKVMQAQVEVYLKQVLPEKPLEFLMRAFEPDTVTFRDHQTSTFSFKPLVLKDVEPLGGEAIFEVWPSLLSAINGADIKALEEILLRGLPIDVAPFGRSALYEACAMGNLKVIDFLFVNGANLHYRLAIFITLVMYYNCSIYSNFLQVRCLARAAVDAPD